jgi:hypothetical protein
MPLPRLRRVRDARSLDDHTDADIAIMDVPGQGPIIGAFASEGGHAPLKRGLISESNRLWVGLWIDLTHRRSWLLKTAR